MTLARPNVSPRAGGLLCLLLACAPGSADHVWMSPAGGAFASGANWSVGSMPGPSDSAVFSLPSTYDVWAAAPMSAFKARISQGDVRLVLAGGGSLELLDSASSMWQHSLDVGGPGAGAALRISGGALLARTAYMARDFSHVASVEVQGEGSAWSNTGEVHVGFAGRASLRVADGAACDARSFIIGGSFSASADALVTGPGAALQAASRLVIGSGGAGALVVDHGATCVAAFADLGAYAGGKGDVRVVGAGSTLHVHQQITVGGSAFSSKAGAGSLIVEKGGSVSAARLVLAEQRDGVASVVVQDADTFISAQSVVVGPEDAPSSIPSASMHVGAGGTLVANDVAVTPHGRLTGDGIINASVENRGVIRPGDESPGVLRIEGDYEQVPGPTYAQATSELQVRLGLSGDAPAGARLQVGGVAKLGGRLRISLMPGFQPVAGQTFRVLSAASVNGAFQQVILPLPTTAWRLRYAPDPNGASIEVLAGGIPGDTNGDCVVNFADLNNVLSNYGQTGLGLIGDANGDGVVNFHDLNLVLSSFGQTC